MKPALLVIDLQNAFSRGESTRQMESAAEYINAALPLFRDKKLPSGNVENRLAVERAHDVITYGALRKMLENV